MRIERAYGSHFELWSDLAKKTRRAKSMLHSRLGDLCQPRRELAVHNRESLFDPKNYYKPVPGHTHSKNNGWLRDLDYRNKDRLRRPAPLLLGEAENSFLWSKPRLVWPRKMSQGCKRLHSIADFLERLEELP